MTEVDIVIIGGGPGGYVAALRARQLGMTVALIERAELGGACLNRGCIPTKALLQTGALAHDVRRAGEFGLRASEPSVDFAAVLKRRDRVVDRLRGGVRTLLDGAGVTVVRGAARVVGPTSVAVTPLDPTAGRGVRAATGGAGGSSGAADVTDDGLVQAAHVLVAGGARPMWPSMPGVGHPRVIDSDGVMQLREPPARLVVLGGGPTGTQIATAFARLGSRVTIVEGSPQLLPLKEPEISAVLMTSMRREGLVIHTETTVARIDETKDGALELVLVPTNAGDGGVGRARETGGSRTAGVASGPAGAPHRGVPPRRRAVPPTVTADLVVVAVGRVPATDGLGLSETGVVTGAAGAVLVDGAYRSSVPTILAVGDVLGGELMLADRAARQAVIAVESLAGLSPRALGEDRIPQVVFTEPEVASVGLTEAAARGQGLGVVTGAFPLAASGRAMLSGTERGLVKVVAEEGSGRLLGVHMAGTHVGELLAEGVLALELGATLRDLASVARTHPTLSEALGEAALAASGEALHVPARRSAVRVGV